MFKHDYLKGIKAFVSFADLDSFAAVADKLNLTSSAVGKKAVSKNFENNVATQGRVLTVFRRGMIIRIIKLK